MATNASPACSSSPPAARPRLLVEKDGHSSTSFSVSPRPTTTFLDLPLAIHKLIASHFNRPRSFWKPSFLQFHLLRLSATARGCLIVYSEQVTEVRIEIGTLVSDANKPSTEEGLQKDWRLRHATVLARLLGRLRNLKKVTYNSDVSHILGRAFLLLSSPPPVISLGYFWGIDIPSEQLEMAVPKGASMLVAAVAEGKIPFLEEVKLPEVGRKSWEDAQDPLNLALLASAITLGKLPRLTSLSLDLNTSVIEALIRAFQTRFELLANDFGGSEQAMVKEVEILGGRKSDWGPAGELLQLPAFEQVERLKVDYLAAEDQGLVDDFVFGSLEECMGQQLTYAAFLRSPGRASCLRAIEFSTYEGDQFIHDDLVQALCEGGAPNLEHLTIIRGDYDVLDQLGDIYRSGALARLEELSFESFEFTEDGVTTWMDGVLASEHKGAALKKISLDNFPLDEEDEDNISASKAFAKALRAGAYPNLETLQFQMENFVSISPHEPENELQEKVLRAFCCLVPLSRETTGHADYTVQYMADMVQHTQQALEQNKESREAKECSTSMIIKRWHRVFCCMHNVK
jgi:hypothetical protein